MKPKIYTHDGQWCVDTPNCPLCLCFRERDDAFEYARLAWMTMLATLSLVEQANSLH